MGWLYWDRESKWLVILGQREKMDWLYWDRDTNWTGYTGTWMWSMRVFQQRSEGDLLGTPALLKSLVWFPSTLTSCETFCCLYSWLFNNLWIKVGFLYSCFLYSQTGDHCITQLVKIAWVLPTSVEPRRTGRLQEPKKVSHSLQRRDLPAD